MTIEKIQFREAIEMLKTKRMDRILIGNGRTYPAELNLVHPEFNFSNETFVITAVMFQLKLPIEDVEDVLLCRATSSMFLYSIRGEVYEIIFEKSKQEGV
jgi:hypothetical protein